jgi:hypothetical protein
MEVFQTYSLDSIVSPSEYQQIVDMISPDFPKKIISDAASYIEPIGGNNNNNNNNNSNSNSNSNNSPQNNQSGQGQVIDNNNPENKKYFHGKLRIALYFHIIYEEWLKYIETIFREEGSLDCLSLYRLRAYLDDCRKNWSISFSQPPLAGVEYALSTVKSGEISFIGLIQALFASPAIRADVTSVPAKAMNLLNAEKNQKLNNKKTINRKSNVSSSSNAAAAANAANDANAASSANAANPANDANAASSANVNAISKISSTSTDDSDNKG